MSRMLAILATGVALQLALPTQSASPVIVVQLCGGGAPIPLPTKNHDSEKQCCKICHSARRGRGGADSCCSKDGGENADA